MTGRERLMSIINGERPDRISWITMADAATRSCMPKEYREMSELEFYRAIGADVASWDYTLPREAAVRYPYDIRADNVATSVSTDKDGITTTKSETPWGVLTRIDKGHPLKYPVETPDDIRVYLKILQNTHVAERCEDNETYGRMNRAISDAGIYTPAVGPSAVQQLIEYEMGPENFYYLLEDHRKDVEEAIESFQALRRAEYDIIARRMPFPAVITVENTSTNLISPAIYRKYSQRHMTEFVDIMHRHGKKAILHMCGLIKNLLEDIKATGLDGIHALTPPTIGDTPFERALDIFGEKLIIFGCSDSSVFHKPGVTRDEIFDSLNRTFTDRLRRANFILLVVADGLPTPVERYFYIKEWMDKHAHH